MTKRNMERERNEGPEFTREGASRSGGKTSPIDQFVEMADKAVDEVTRVGKSAFNKNNVPKLAAGAALGAVAGIILPVIAWPLGAIVGVGYVAYREANKRR